MDFSKILFRASSLGNLMTEPVGKSNMQIYLDAKAKHELLSAQLLELKQYNAKGEEMKSYLNKKEATRKAEDILFEAELLKDKMQLSDGAKTHLVDIYVSAVYGRKTEIFAKAVNKGLMVEEDSITLYSRVTKTFHKKNEAVLKNAYIQGTPDLFTGLEIYNADTIIDVKSSWDIFTFHRVISKPLNSLYYWQLQAYMALTGASASTLAYCLINTPEMLINDEKRKLLYKMGVIYEMDSDYVKACDELERTMVYDDIPLEKRLIKFNIERNEEDMQKAYKKIELSREYLSDLHQKLNP